jgi:hypothetical protein
MVEEDSSDIVQMSVECKETSPSLVGPDFDLVVVCTRHKERLGLVEVNATNWSIVLFKSVYERSHSVIP